MPIDTRMNGPQALRTTQGVAYNPVQTHATKLTGGDELAQALGVFNQGFTNVATGMAADKDARDIQDAKIEFSKMSPADRMIVVGHPAYQEKSYAFRQTLNKLQADALFNETVSETEAEMKAGKLQSAEAVQAFMNDRRAEKLNGIQDKDFLSHYDDQFRKAASQYGIVGGAIKGKNELDEATTTMTQNLAGVIKEKGMEAAYQYFHDNNPGNFKNADANHFMLAAGKVIAADPNIKGMDKLNILNQMSEHAVTDKDGKVLGQLGSISTVAPELDALRTHVQAQNLKESAAVIGEHAVTVMTVADGGDVNATIAKMKELQGDKNPAIAHWAATNYDKMVNHARHKYEALMQHKAVEMEKVQSKMALDNHVNDIYSRMLQGQPLNSLTMQDTPAEITVTNKLGQPEKKQLMLTHKMINDALTLKAAQESNRWYAEETQKNGKAPTRAEWYEHDMKLWGDVGMIPPFHKEIANQSIGALRQLSPDAKQISDTGAQALNTFRELRNRPELAQEIYGEKNMQYLYGIDMMSKRMRYGDAAAVLAVNKLPQALKESADIGKQAEDAITKEMAKEGGWNKNWTDFSWMPFELGGYKQMSSNNAKIDADYRYLTKVLIANDMNPEDAAKTAKEHIVDNSEQINTTRIYKSDLKVVPLNGYSNYSDLFKDYLQQTYIDPNKAVKNSVHTASIEVMEKAGAVTGYRLMKNQGAWGLVNNGTSKSFGAVTDDKGNDIVISVDQLKQFQAHMQQKRKEEAYNSLTAKAGRAVDAVRNFDPKEEAARFWQNLDLTGQMDTETKKAMDAAVKAGQQNLK